MAGRANAQAVNYIGPDGGDWSLATNWSFDGFHFVPGIDEDAALGATGTATYMTMDYTYTGDGLDSLTLDATVVPSFTLDQASGAMIATTETIGDTTTGNEYAQTGGTNTINSDGVLYLGYGSDSSGTYTLGYNGTGGTLTLGGGAALVVGFSGAGTFTQSGGTVTDNGNGATIIVGDEPGSDGSYNLSGGSINMMQEFVGNNGAGSFVQTGGTNEVGINWGVQYGLTVGGDGVLGQTVEATGSGSYTLNEGLLSAGNEYIGFGGTGTFIQMGGSNNVEQGALIGIDGYLFLGYNSIDRGSYTLVSGTLSSFVEEIGDEGVGIFSQTGGLNEAYQYLIIGISASGVGAGSYALSGGTLSAESEQIGYLGLGAFVQTGGTNEVQGSFSVGGDSVTGQTNNFAASGSYTLSGGLLSASNEFIGFGGNGTFIQTAGSNGMTGSNVDQGDLILGYNSIDRGSYTLASGTLSVSTTEYIGDYGTGTFNQTGGANSGGAPLVIGDEALSSGSYGLSGSGLLFAVSETVGSSGTGIFNQMGGYNATDLLEIGGQTGGFGSYTLASGNLNTVPTFQPSIVGYDGTGVFTQTGGQFETQGGLTLGYDSGGSGTYLLESGTIQSAGEEVIGSSGIGIFNQTGGYNQDSNLFLVANSTSSTGSYGLSGSGALFVAEYESIGSQGTGTFNQTGGLNTTEDGLGVGDSAGSNGLYLLTSGTLMSGIVGPGLIPGSEYIGNAGTGVFMQSGGYNTPTGSIYVGYQDLSSGSYELSGSGLLSATSEYIGESGAGVFNQAGGANSAGAVTLGDQAGSYGTYLLSGGTLSAGAEYIGNYGTGAFTQTGGTNTVTQQLSVLGTTSSFTLNPPAASTAVLSASTELIGSGGTINQFGGTNTVTGLLQVGNGVAPSYYSLGGGTLTAQEELIGSGGAYDSFGQGSGTNTIGTGGSLIIETGYYELGGGVLYAPNSVGGFVTQSQGAFFDMLGGTEYGYLQNFGEIAYTAGTFNGFLENDGLVYLHASFVAGSGILNNATISVTSGLGIYGGGTGLDNEGELDLANGAVGGTSLLNDGLISGYGTIDGDNFSNYGLVTQGAGNLTLSATGANQNFSTITLASGRQLRLTGATLVNQGTLALSGGIVTGVAELDNSVGGLITGPGSILGPFSNDSGGTVEIAAGTVSVSHAFTNAGLISLTGVTANLTGAAVTNNGTIQGVGSVGSTSVTNAGIIEAIGGTLDVSGALINSSGGQILAGSGDKVLVTQGLASNASLINLTGGTFDNNSHALANTGQISGYGTFRTGGLTNDATATFSGGQTTVNGNVTNAGGATITVAQNPAIFTGNVTNSAGATFKTVSTTVTFSGTFTNNGSYISDPSTQNFDDLVEGASGSISAGVGDVFNVSGNVLNTSTENTLFNISQSQLTLQGSVIHTFEWPGADLGPSDAGYTNNFSIGIFELQAGGSLTLSGTGAGGAGIYVGVLDLDSILADGTQSAQLTALDDISNTITGNGSNIYYNPSLSGNSYLDGGTYALAGGGEITPTPEPGTRAMFAMAAGAGLLEIRRRRVSKTVSKWQ